MAPQVNLYSPAQMWCLWSFLQLILCSYVVVKRVLFEYTAGMDARRPSTWFYGEENITVVGGGRRIYFDEGSMAGNKEICKKNIRINGLPNADTFLWYVSKNRRKLPHWIVCFALFRRLIIDVVFFYSHRAPHQRIIVNCGEGKRSLIFAESLLIPGVVLEKLKALCSKYGCDLIIAHLWLFCVYLSQWLGQAKS